MLGLSAACARRRAVAATDPNFSNVSALLKFDGNFTDVKGHTFTASGDIVNTTNKAVYTGTGTLTGPQSGTDFNLGNTWTIEFDLTTTTSGQLAASQWYSAGSMVGMRMALSAEAFGFGQTAGSPAASISGGASYAAALHHVAIVSSATIGKLFIDGVERWSFGSTPMPNVTTFNNQWFQVAGGSSSNGTVDNLRITKGVARYTADFVVPNRPYPES